MRYGLIGEKLGHSFSKEIHEQLADYTYDLIPLSKEAFPIFMKERNFHAINVTIPYKKDVIPYLNHIDAHAKEIGAVNTIVNRNGTLYGYNTDHYGFAYMLKKHKISLQQKRVLIIGNGGAAAAIKAVVKANNASACISVSRSGSQGSLTYEELRKKHYDPQIIINTSPVGMYPNNDAMPIDLSCYPHVEALLDVIYNPLDTLLVREAKKRGITAVGGLEMLVAQAKQAVELFCDCIIDESMIDSIYKKITLKERNLVFIGMPSSGKSTIAKQIATHFDMELIDMDEEIEKKTGKSIPTIFEKLGERGFREIETHVCKEVSKQHHCVISTGGGIIKHEINMNHLKTNGYIVFIDRDVSLLSSGDSKRPLSTNQEAVEKLYHERIDLYRKYADVIVENNSDLFMDCTEELILKLTK